jgi:hypothetical protein
VSGKIEKIPFCFGREDNERVRTNRRGYARIFKIRSENYRAIFNAGQRLASRREDGLVGFGVGWRPFLLRASLGCSMEYDLKVENVNASITVDVSIVVRARALQYLGYDDLDILNVDSVVAVGVPHIGLIT